MWRALMPFHDDDLVLYVGNKHRDHFVGTTSWANKGGHHGLLINEWTGLPIRIWSSRSVTR